MMENRSVFTQVSYENNASAQRRENLLYGTSEPNSKMYNRVCTFIREVVAKDSSFDIANHLKQLLWTEFSACIDSKFIDGMAKCCSCIYEIAPSVCYNDIYSQLIEDFGKLEHTSLSETQWRRLYRYAEMHGLFRLAVLLRRKYKNALKECNTSNRLWRKLQCALEDDDFDEASRLLAIMCNDNLYKEYCMKDLDTATWFIDTLKGTAKAHDRYSDFLQNKRIHIYGPLEYEAKRIPEDEIVARIDDRLNRSSDDRTNVLYINYEVSEMMKDYSAKYWKKFDYVCLKEKCILPSAPNSRSMRNFSNLFLFGFPNMIPLMLIDFLFSGAKDICLSGINLYCSSKPYGNGYEGFLIMNDSQLRKRRIQDWCDHDVLSQYYFMKNLYKKNSFAPSNELQTVLTMTDEEYALNMEREHLPELLLGTAMETL